jgi:GT2 family glycosyltransferase
MIKVSATIVIYKEKEKNLKKVIGDFMSINLEKELIIVDNSPKPDLKFFCKQFENLQYIFNGKNLGFGKAHNLAFKNLSIKSDLHLIINPDVCFDPKKIQDMLLWMYKDSSISLCVPKVLFPSGIFQHTVRNIPNFIVLIKRKLGIMVDEWKEEQLQNITEIPFAHGCFFVFRTDVYKRLAGFDERFFMYMEDVDIFMRAKLYGKTLYNPNYQIYHEFRKGSSKSPKLLCWHTISAFKFFWKYR